MSDYTCASTTHMSLKQEDQQHSFQDPHASNSVSAPLYELQDVIQQYKAHPELLKLILTSKVEEDKRRAEEAKLRAKELDYYLKHDSNTTPPSPPSLSTNYHQQQSNYQRKMSIPSRISVNQDRSAPYPTSTHSTTATSPLSPSRRASFDHHQQRRHSAATAMLAMGGSVSPSTLPALLPSLSPPSDRSSNASSSDDDEMDHSAIVAYPSPVTDHYDDQEETSAGSTTGKPRRRREMQAITKIVETREFPYMDSYFWRNNGNTTQKKTGCRSIYYKCSNSNKGCQVNKTVTAKQNGEYLIKYRGTHLTECGMVERIRDL
ncbi:hypothetical protein BCR42DRAFT_409184 [Absidia repens]|uniref:WRKY domain-containing protein n=1 Tax=Absidia repens TaxID=90262 RepID=A0A1X2IQT1_9FUNG|nr:hypothetical protein BCR42DRAFT_409184 [Absidia repens]